MASRGDFGDVDREARQRGGVREGEVHGVELGQVSGIDAESFTGGRFGLNFLGMGRHAWKQRRGAPRRIWPAMRT